jgi:plasmid segregation protein ParM
VNRLWEDDWDIDSIILSGGGSMELAPFILPQIQGNVIPLASDVDARLNNVQGYLKFARYKWGYSEAPSPEPLDKQEAVAETSDDTAPGNDDPVRGARGRGWLKGARA